MIDMKNELMAVVVNENMEQVVSGRELHSKLEIGTPFKKWIDRMCEYGFVENIDFVTVGQKCPIANGGFQEQKEYILTLEMAKQICMLQRNEVGMKFRKYFIEIEKAWNDPSQVMARALHIAHKSIEDCKDEIKQLQYKVEEDRPKVELVDSVLEADNYFDARQLANMLNVKGVGRNKLLEFLREKEILDCGNNPYRRFVDEGYCKQVMTGKSNYLGYPIMKTVFSVKMLEKLVKYYKGVK